MAIETAWIYFSSFVTACSFAALLLPPIEYFNEFPRFQPYYRLFCKIIIKWGSLDLRGKIITMYDSYQKKNGNGKPPEST